MNLSFLDYIWRGLTAGTLTSLIVLSVLFLTSLILNKFATRQYLKYFFHSQILLMILVFAFSFSWVACVDSDLARGCFNTFAKDKNFFTLTRLFAGLWVLGVVGLMMWDAWRIFRFSLPTSEARDPQIQALFETLKNKLQIRNEVKLVLSTAATSPHVNGFIRHHVVLPKTLLLMPQESLEHILAHELVHVRDRDSLWKALELFVRRVLFFNPLMYVLAYRYLLAIEKAADEEAVRCLAAEPKAYISTLLEVLSLHRWMGQSPLALNASRTFLETKERMQSLVISRKPRGKTVTVLILGSLLLSLGFSMAQARSSVNTENGLGTERGLMCQQVHHEQVIESWLHIKAETNKCE